MASGNENKAANQQKPAKRELSIPARVIHAITAQGKFAEYLPAPYRPSADRMLRRAELYIATCRHRADLWQCSVPSMVSAILQAGEFGLTVDGRMAHLVPYNNKIKGDDGKEHWVREAQFMPDYKGLVAVGRRHKAFEDAVPRMVYENDQFDYGFEDGKWFAKYRPSLGDRGKVLGAFCIVSFEGGRYVVEYMSNDEIESIRARSKAKSGPWFTDTDQMRCKTVLRRAIKSYTDDPEMLELMTLDDQVSGLEEIEHPPAQTRVSINSLSDLFRPKIESNDAEDNVHRQQVDEAKQDEATEEPSSQINGEAQEPESNPEVLAAFGKRIEDAKITELSKIRTAITECEDLSPSDKEMLLSLAQQKISKK